MSSDKPCNPARLRKTSKTYQNKRYLKNERKIISVLCVSIHDRRMNVQAREFCRQAKITAPTFYLHYRNSDDVRIGHEKQIIAELNRRVPECVKPDLFFTILISQIVKNQEYFLATNHCKDYCLLHDVLRQYRTNLVGNRLSDRSFTGYSGKIIIVIATWLEYDDINAQTAQQCVRNLLKVRV